tara:strand:- start:485 stop:1648 length:1164 start_codon:yes stop_codon:yes gene_type:complete
MAKKAVISLKGNDITINGTYKFIDEYNKWVKKCQSISSKRMLSEGRKIRRDREGKKKGQIDTKSGQAHPNNLYAQLEQHVTSSYRRDNSPNKGGKGTFTLLKDIQQFMKDFPDVGFLTEEHRGILETDNDSFKKKIDKYAEPNSTLNPKNITFKSPKKFDNKGNNLGSGEESKGVYYGHYANKWFKTKYPDAKQAPEGWYSTSKNTANPPLAQALFGRGDLVKVGLKDVIDIAIAELNKGIENIDVQVRRPSELSRFTAIRKHVFSLLNNKSLFSKGGRPNLNKMAASFQGMRFTISGRTKGRKYAGTEKESLSFVAGLEEVPAGNIKYFTLKPFQKQAMASLIVAVVGKGKSKKLRWGDYLNVRGLKVPKVVEDNVKKSWHEYLWG